MPETLEQLGFEPDIGVRIPREAPGQAGIDSIAYRNSNPGNIRVPGSKEFRQYNSPEEGFRDVENTVRRRADQGHTLESYISSYAPKKDGNYTEGYIRKASAALGVDRKTPLKEIDAGKLAAFQAKQESGTEVRQSDTLESLGFESKDKPGRSLESLGFEPTGGKSAPSQPPIPGYGLAPGVPQPKVPGLNVPVRTQNPVLAARPELSDKEFQERIKGEGGTPDFGLGDTISGLVKAGAGARSVATGTDTSGAPYPRARGAAEAIEGTLEAATPAFAAGAVAQPIIAARTAVTALLAQEGTRAALKKAGVSEDNARLAADVAGVAAAGWTVKDLVDAARKVAEPFQPGQRFGKPLEGEVFPPEKPAAPTAELPGQKPPIDIQPAPPEPQPGSPPAPSGAEAQVSQDQPLPAEAAAASAPSVPSAAPPAVQPGAVFETPGGKFTVKSVEGGKVSYEKESPGGQVITGKLPENVFGRMVARATPLTQPQTQTAPPAQVPPAATQPPAQQPVAEPAPIPTPPQAPVIPASGLNEVKGTQDIPLVTDIVKPGTEPPEVGNNPTESQIAIDNQHPEPKYSSTQVNLHPEIAAAVRDFGATIPESQLSADGREPDPHITLKYGLHPDAPLADVAQALKGEGPVTAKLGRLSVFSNPDGDVLKVDVSSPDLHRMNAKVSEAVPTTDTHPQYQPHVTVAYLKPGEGAQYVGKSLPGVTGKTVTFNSVTFSPHEGEKAEIPLSTGVQTAPSTGKPKLGPLVIKPLFGGKEEIVPGTEPPTDEGLLKGTEALSKAVAEKLGNNESLGDNVAFQKMAREAFGDVDVSPRDKYDALEAGVNRHLTEDRAAYWAANGSDGIAALHEVEDKLPTQTHRTEEQIKEQQFSTPPSLALLAAKMLNPTATDTVLEPSAGTGNLAIWPRAAGAKVITNELAPRRSAILKMQGFPVTNLDARHINDLLPTDVKPTAVLMNPPFSSDPRSGKHDTGVGVDHVEQALATLQPGGRLVAILGTKQGNPEAPKLTDRWQKIAKKYNIRASIEIDGEAYRKYGTTFGNSVVVIDNTGPTPGATWEEKTQNIQRGHYKTPEEAWDGVQNIARDRSAVPEGSGETQPKGTVGPDRPGGGAVQSGQPGRVGVGSEPGERGTADGGSRVPTESRPEGGPENLPRNEPATRPPEVVQSEQQPAGESSLADIRGVTAERERTEERGGSFVSYAPQRLPDAWGAVKHQANIVETASMAAIDPPPITEKPKVDWDLVKKGDISEVQLEAIAYAVQAHQQFLPSGERVGFFVGDGTGVGKGREIAGTIQHYWNSGTRRIVWVSYSTDLKEDAERDLRDIKADIPVRLINDFKRGSNITMGDGVIFLTYQSLASGAVGKDATGAAGPKAFLRLDQLKKWAGEEPVIIFDEAHKAKNSTEEKGNRGRQKASDSGLATVGLQAQIPKAKVVYSSATGATDVRNLGYASRLGLWGVGSSFDTFDDFRGAISSGGVGAMEVVARDMKAQGRYLSRFISFDGVEYREVTHNLTPPQVDLYNTAAKAWQTVFQNFNKAIEVTEGGGRARAAAMSAFWGANQRFFRQFVTSMKMPTLLKEIEAAREAGKSVVVSLMGTGAAQAERELSRIKEEEGSLDDLDFSAADTLIKLIEKSFPTVKYVDSVDDNGNPTKVMLTDADGRPVESKEALAMKDELLSRLQGLRFPEHPIDQIISKFGHENVAELTGRKNQFLTDEKTGKKEVHRRKKEGVPLDKTNISEARDFQQGNKHISIISAAASTGISLHADKRAVNQERRVHIVLETKWSADTQMQDFGRTHRTNQAMPPEYVLMSSNVGGEKRFLSTIARRLSQLGALTRGQRDAASSGDLAKYNFESEYGTSATQSALDSMAHDGEQKLGFEGDQALVDMGLIKELPQASTADFASVDVPNFLNRTLSLEPDRQNKVFNLFLDNFEQAIKLAKERGTFDEGVEDIKSPSIKLVEPAQVVKRQEATGAKTYYYNLSEAYRPVRRSFEGAQANDAPLGFFKNSISGNVYAVGPTLSVETDAASGATHERVRLSDVHGGSRLARKAELAEKYQPVPPTEARKWWDDEYSKIPALAHRPLHIIGGSIMPVWNVLQSGGHGLKTVRLKTDDGQYIVGARIANDAISRVLRGLGFNSNIKLSPEDVQQVVMHQGEVLDLAGDMKLRKVKLSGEDRMEVLNVPYTQEKTIQSFGVSKEFIQHRTRFFVNTHDEEALPNLLKQYPVVGSATGANLRAPNSVDLSAMRIPSLPDADRTEPFLSSAPTQVHMRKASIEPIELDARDVPFADAYVASVSAMELIGRTAGLPADFAGRTYVGMHITSQDLGRLSKNLTTLARAYFPGGAPKGVERLIASAQKASSDGKSLVFIADHTNWEKYRDTALAEELDHAAQSQLSGAPRTHLGTSLEGFLTLPLARKASRYLSYYGDIDRGTMGAEIGVRLMRPDGWKELGISAAEARILATNYVRALRSEYGSHPPTEIAKRIFSAARKSSVGRSAGKSSEVPERSGPEGGAGPSGGTGSDLSGYRPKELADEGNPRDNRSEPTALKTLPAAEVNGERGAAPILTDIPTWVAEQFHDDGPKLNYSGMGALKRVILPGRQLKEIEEASRNEVFPAAVLAGGSESQMSVILQAGAPAVRKALEGSDVSFDEMRLALLESNVRGKRERWQNFANQVAASDDAEIERSLSPNADGTPSFYINLLSNIEGRQGLAQDLGQTASTLAEEKDWGLLRDFLHQTFSDAASRVAVVMEPEWFDHVAGQLQNDEHGKEALKRYDEMIAKPIAESHAINEGVFSNTYGPLGVYYPMIAMQRKLINAPGRRLAYHKPRNLANYFATGLSDDYDVSMESLAKKISANLRANSKAALIQTLRDTGWAKPESQATRAEDGKLSMVGPDGVEYQAERKETSAARTMIVNGKPVRIPAKFDVLPRFVTTGLGTVLENKPMDPNDVAKAMRWANSLATKGPFELIYHSTGVLGSLYANTPFLGKSGLDKALSLPLVKWFAIRKKLFSIDPQSPESIRKLQVIAKAGALPSKSGRFTYNKQFSKDTGAILERLSFSPLLYGPRGIDVRARLLMYDIWKAAFPGGSVADLHDFVNQIGNYTPEFQGAIERFLKHSGFGTFATAGMTRLVNSGQNYTGGPTWNQGNWKVRAAWLMTASAWMAIAIWMVSHKVLTGKNPDKRSRFNDIPVGGGNGFIDPLRHSAPGNALWGKGSQVGHINLSYFNDPLSLRGARAMGLSGAFEAHQLGAKPWQMAEAANKDVLNALSGPALGPAAKALFVLGTGSEPSITGFRDPITGRAGLQLYPAVPNKTKPGFPTYGARAFAAARELNSFYLDSGEHLGEMTGLFAPNKSARGNWWVQTAFQLGFPGLFAPASNPTAKSQMLHKQAAAAGKR